MAGSARRTTPPSFVACWDLFPLRSCPNSAERGTREGDNSDQHIQANTVAISLAPPWNLWPEKLSFSLEGTRVRIKTDRYQHGLPKTMERTTKQGCTHLWLRLSLNFYLPESVLNVTHITFRSCLLAGFPIPLKSPKREYRGGLAVFGVLALFLAHRGPRLVLLRLGLLDVLPRVEGSCDWRS